MNFKQKKKDKHESKDLLGRFCLFDSEAEQKALGFLHIQCLDKNIWLAPESNKQIRYFTIHKSLQ